MRVVQIEPGPAVGEIFRPGGAGDIAGDDGEEGKRLAEQFHHVTDPGAVPVRRGNGDSVDGLVHERAHMRDDLPAIEFSRGVAQRGDRRARHQAKMRVPAGLPARLHLADDAFDISAGDKAAQMVLVVHHQHLVDADVFAEKGVRVLDRVVAKVAFANRRQPGPRRHRLGDFL